MDTLAGRVAFVTGAARGMGRAHAVKLASEGVDVIALDICQGFPFTGYPGASPDDLNETVRLVEAQGRRIVARQADVRDPDAVAAVVADGLGAFGRLDIVIANAGVIRVTDSDDRAGDFRSIVEVNLIGAWNTVEAAIPALIAGVTLAGRRWGPAVAGSGRRGSSSAARAPTCRTFSRGCSAGAAAAVAAASPAASVAAPRRPRRVRTLAIACASPSSMRRRRCRSV